MKDFVTELEATAKRCPLIETAPPKPVLLPPRAGGSGTSTAEYGTSYEPAKPPLCLASSCMAWRWSHQDSGPIAEPTGFCGAFGLPRYV